MLFNLDSFDKGLSNGKSRELDNINGHGCSQRKATVAELGVNLSYIATVTRNLVKKQDQVVGVWFKSRNFMEKKLYTKGGNLKKLLSRPNRAST